MKTAYLGKPGLAKLIIKAGAKVTASVLVNSNGVPTDWTGYTFESQVRKDTSARSELLATIDVVHEDDPTTGVLLVTVDATELEEGVYEYDVRATIGEGDDAEKPFVLEGELEVEGSVTRDEEE